MKYSIPLIIWMMAFAATAQEATYTLSLGSRQVGTLSVQQTLQDGITTVLVQSEASVSLGFTFKISYTQQSRYKDGRLLDAEVKIYKNGELYNSATTQWQGNGYRINHNGKNLKLEEEVHFSSTRLYFDEPRGVLKLYSESDCEVRTVDKLKRHSYRVSERHSRRKNDYHYKDGILQNATIHHTLINFNVALQSYSGQ